MKNSSAYLAIALLLLSLWPSLAAAEAPCLRIGVTSGTAGTDELAALTRKIFAKAKLCVTIMEVPRSRINAMEDVGELDGDGGREPGYFETKPYLIRVPTSLASFDIQLYWPTGHQEPSGGDAVIGAMLGSFWPRKIVAKLGGRVFEANSYDQLFQMAESGHLQGFLMSSVVFQKLTASRLNASHFQSRQIDTVPLHLALNRRCAAMVPALDMAIKSLVADGTANSTMFHKTP